MSDMKLVRHVRVQIRANWTYFRSSYIFYLFREIHYGLFYVRVRFAGYKGRLRSATECIRHFELVENELNLRSDGEARI